MRMWLTILQLRNLPLQCLPNKGWTNKEIAEYLGITQRTVKQHLTCVFNKLNIENRKQLKNFMLR